MLCTSNGHWIWNDVVPSAAAVAQAVRANVQREWADQCQSQISGLASILHDGVHGRFELPCTPDWVNRRFSEGWLFRLLTPGAMRYERSVSRFQRRSY